MLCSTLPPSLPCLQGNTGFKNIGNGNTGDLNNGDGNTGTKNIGAVGGTSGLGGVWGLGGRRGRASCALGLHGSLHCLSELDLCIMNRPWAICSLHAPLITCLLPSAKISPSPSPLACLQGNLGTENIGQGNSGNKVRLQH